MRKLFITIGIISFVLVGLYFTPSFKINSLDPIISQSYEVPIIQNQILLDRLKYIGAKYTDNLGLVLTDDLQSESLSGIKVNPTTLGFYQNSSDRIIVKSGLDYGTETKVIAHEYMHYIWERFITEDEKPRIVVKANIIIDNDTYLTKYIDYRKTNGTYLESELLPIVCTEHQDNYVRVVLDTCNKYIDSSKLTLILDK